MCYNISQRHELGAYYEIYFKSTQFAEGGGSESGGGTNFGKFSKFNAVDIKY